MNTIQQLTKFFDSEAFEMLATEAETNQPARDLMNDLRLFVDSAIFFHTIGDVNRADREIAQTKMIASQIEKIYE
jgi:hypothetical protein